MRVYFTRGLRQGRMLAALPALLFLGACTTTQKAPVENRAAICSFLGTVCNKLTKGGEGQLDLRYVNTKANWTQYKSVIVDPVVIWSSSESNISQPDQQRLANYFYESLKQHLSTRFTIADAPGTGVMRLQVALTDAQGATPGLRTITMAIPQARTLSTLGYLATGSYPFVGAAQGAAKLTDSMSGDLLAAVADRQIGGGHIKAAAQWTLGDAQNAIDHWAEGAANKLAAWTSGAEQPK
ncbi:MAG: DUF3313 domain-containing protein [Methylotetracoccus sp.]